MTANAIADWLLDEANRHLPMEELIPGLADQLAAVGIDVWRISASVMTLHPLVFVRNTAWIRGRGCESVERSHEVKQTPMYLASPVAAIQGGSDAIRRKLTGPDEQLDYPLCRELAAEGGTDYLALPLIFRTGRRSYISFATRAPAGFTDEQLSALHAVTSAVGMRVELDSAYWASESLLQVYLGRNAAERVQAGAFQRGTGELIKAAIWFCDLRGFTELSDRRRPQDVVIALDGYFERVIGAISEAGGEVLKLIGDAVLACFPVSEGDEELACRSALTSAKEALARMRAWNEERVAGGEPPMQIGVALHLGEVMYGNIGGPDRLDFTVIGASVNEVCRLESLCKPLDVPLVISAPFAARVPDQPLLSLGHHALKGVSEPPEVLTAAEHAPAGSLEDQARRRRRLPT